MKKLLIALAALVGATWAAPSLAAPAANMPPGVERPSDQSITRTRMHPRRMMRPRMTRHRVYRQRMRYPRMMRPHRRMM